MLERGANLKIGIPLNIAAQEDDTDMIYFFIEHGCEVNEFCKEDETPLYVACSKGNTNAVSMLLNLGANNNLVNKKYGHKPSTCAIIKGNIEILTLFIHQNINIYESDTP